MISFHFYIISIILTILIIMIFMSVIHSFQHIKHIQTHRKIKFPFKYDFYMSSSNVVTSNDKSIQNEEFELILKEPLKLSVFVDPNILKYINISNSYRKKTLKLPKRFLKNQLTIEYIKDCINKLIPELSNNPYILRYYNINNIFRKQFINSNDIIKIFQQINNGELYQLYVDINPTINFPLNIYQQEYLKDIPDYLESSTLTILSFYKFVNISDPDNIAINFEYIWKRFGVLGRVYVANEGINAQVAIPTNMLDIFHKSCLNEFPHIFGNNLYLNIDHTLSIEQYEITKPFKALHVRVRDQIVADGFLSNPDIKIDWTNGGKEMPPLEWHKALDNPNTLVLDCRNSYESDVGIFKNAIPLNTTFFRDSWDILDEILDSKPKDTPILTYCTGGIRCVKINAYLEQKLGFNNVNRLQGGIIAYSREVEQSKQNIIETNSYNELASKLPNHHLERNVIESKFKGMNYVFDERMGAKITSDILTICETCGNSCDYFTNCNNFDCHVRFIQCNKCKDNYNGCCSSYCKKSYEDVISKSNINTDHEIVKPLTLRKKTQKIIEINDNEEESNSNHDDIKTKDHTTNANILLESLDKYCELYSSQESELLNQLREETITLFESGSRMLCSQLQGQLLTLLSIIHKPKYILELGTFTGYATICLANGLINNDNSKVYSCDVDNNTLQLAKKYVDLSNLNNNIEIHNKKGFDMLTYARNNFIKFDMVFIDADKKQYTNYLLDLMGYIESNDTIINDNTKYIKSKDSLLNPNAIIIIDNTLWKGLVLRHELELINSAPELSLFGDSKRMETLSLVMHSFNSFVKSFSHKLQVIILPIRDGLTIIRYLDNDNMKS